MSSQEETLLADLEITLARAAYQARAVRDQLPGDDEIPRDLVAPIDSALTSCRSLQDIYSTTPVIGW